MFELDGVTEGDQEEDEVEAGVDGEDGKDVELVSREVEVQVVPGLPISQPELVSTETKFTTTYSSQFT